MDRTTKSLSEPGIVSRLAWTRNPECSIGRPEGWSSESIANRRGDGEETGDCQDDRDTRQAAERGDDQGGSVGQGSDAVLARDRARLRVRDGSSEQSTSGGAVPPQTVPHNGQDEERTRVQGRGDVGIRRPNVIGDERRVEDGEDHEQQEHAVEEHESAIDLSEG